ANTTVTCCARLRGRTWTAGSSRRDAAECTRAARAQRGRPFGDLRAALEAELRGGRQLGPAAGAARGEGGAALAIGAVATALRAGHVSRETSHGRAPRDRQPASRLR